MTVAELIKMLQKCAQDAQVQFVDYDDGYNPIESVSEIRRIGSDEDEDTVTVELR